MGREKGRPNADTGGRVGQEKNDKMTQQGGGGGDGEQSDDNFDPKCSSGYVTSVSKSFRNDYRGPKRVGAS